MEAQIAYIEKYHVGMLCRKSALMQFTFVVTLGPVSVNF